MRTHLPKRWLRLTLAVAAAMAILGLRAAPATGGNGQHYSAFAVDLDAPPGAKAAEVLINIERWSTDAERDLVFNTIFETSPDRLLDVVRKLPRVGSIRTPQSLGWDLRYARRTPGPDGGERVVMLTDRPISFWEVRGMSRTLDYPFTVIDLRIGSNGEGEGKMTVGTKITADKEDRTIVLENYTAQPVMLQKVRRENGKALAILNSEF